MEMYIRVYRDYCHDIPRNLPFFCFDNDLDVQAFRLELQRITERANLLACKYSLNISNYYKKLTDGRGTRYPRRREY